MKEIKRLEKLSLDFLLNDPLCKKVSAKIIAEVEGPYEWTTTSPEGVLYEQQQIAYNSVAGFNRLPVGSESWWWWHDIPEENRCEFWGLMRVADPFLWDTDIFHAAMSLKVPVHTIKKDELPIVPTYWAYTRPIVLTGTIEGEPQEAVVSGILWYPIEGTTVAIPLIELRSLKKPSDRQCLDPVIYTHNAEWDPEEEHKQGGPFQEQLLAACAFLRAQILSVDPTPVERSLRRKTEKKTKKRQGYQIPLVKIVKLRKVTDTLPASNNGNKRSYTHRWLVSGHLRNQWYPSEGIHKLIYINPFIKGPEGADLLPTRRTVNKVVR